MKLLWIWRLVETILYCLLCMSWVYFAFHYKTILTEYAALDYHVLYPSLYIAVENWLLFCLLVLTCLIIIGLREVRNFIKEDENK